MKVEKKDLARAQVELTVELSVDELKPYFDQAIKKLANEIEIKGFRPGKAPYEILKQKIGEMSILEEASRIAINKIIDRIIKENVSRPAVGQPQINISKLAPNNPLEFKIILSLLPEAQIGNYKDLKIKLTKAEVADEEVKIMIEQLRETRVEEALAEREVRDEDKVIVDIGMFLDKIPVEGGQGKDTAVIIGKNYIIPGFDKKLIGARKNEERKFSLPYPESHHLKNLAGKLVDFSVKIKEVYQRELPEVNEQFAAAFGLKSAAELKNNIKKTLLEEKQAKNLQQAEIEILDKIMAKSKLGDIPETLISHEGEVMLSELENNIAQQGGKFEDYLKSLNKTREQLILDLLPQAVKRVKSALIIREISIIEKIEATETEVEKNQEEVLAHYKGNKEIEQRVKSGQYKNYLYNAITNRKVIEKLREWNVAKQ